MSKAVFFDIDGTLCDNNGIIPQSTKETIHKLKEKGIYTFICSGRALAFMNEPNLMTLEVDGIIAGCGTYIVFRTQELLNECIPVENLKKALNVLEKYDYPVILEGKTYYYVEKKSLRNIPFGAVLKQIIGKNLVGITENDMKWEVNKFAAFIKERDYENIAQELGALFDFKLHEGIMLEGMPKGFSKAYGIQTVCERLQIAHQDTYAFGDSVNDVEMLEYVAHGIAMGNGTQEAKQSADYVTDGIHEDGIYNACKHFSLI